MPPWFLRRPFYSRAKGEMITRLRGPKKPAIHFAPNGSSDPICTTHGHKRITGNVLKVTCQLCRFHLREALAD